MKLNNKTLDAWLKNPPIKCFKYGRKTDYYSKYCTIKEHLDSRIHKIVEIGARLQDPTMVLNDHGPDHVTAVIEKASELVSTDQCNLNALEVYILLVCIQFHDVGNIFGRYEHELNSKEIIEKSESIIGLDTTEIKVIWDIVKAHGGTSNRGDKDTINDLNEIELFNDNDVRARFLAAILRFADELADDKRRTKIELVNLPNFPRQSQIFHIYSLCLDNVVVKHIDRAVELHFKIPKDFVTDVFGKQDESILLLDEIYNRVMKMHLERIYFMRFTLKSIDIQSIIVFIDFFDKYISQFDPITFTISETGYPDANGKTIFDICPELIDDEGIRRDGRYIINKYIKKDERKT